MARRVAYALALALVASPALAQQQMCAPIAQMTERLSQAFGEHLAAGGLTTAGRLLQVYANREKGTWTVTVTTPDGVSCLVSSGEAFAIELPEAPKPQGRVS